MKLTTLILITVILHVSATSMAQKVTLKTKNASLTDVFDQIRTQTGYDFALTSDALKDAKPVTINIINEELKDALIEILKGQNLDFSLDNKIVVIKPKETSFFDDLKNKIKAELAQVTVKGTVTDATNQPMAGVNVRESGTQNGTTTDIKGAFSLTVTSNDAIVAFSYIGYETKVLTPKDLPKGVVITLKASENNLREVVISKGYYDEKQALSTGDVTVVSAKEIAEQPVTDPMVALIGRVPGLQITPASGIPGANETILLRGQSSIANGNSPFFIIDGVPFSSTSPTNPWIGGGAFGFPGSNSNVNTSSGMSPFNMLNPDDIENIEVLKDADATAIYGSRGANGVILITTKKGKAGNTKVDVDFSQGTSKVTHFMDLMNTQQYLQMRHEAFALDARNPGSSDHDINGDWDTTRYTNWQKVLIGNTAHSTNAQVSVSGGSENTQFYVGSGFSRNTTVFPGDYEDEKGSLNFSLTNSSANKRFQISFTGGYTHDNNNEPNYDLTQNVNLAPDAPALFRPNGSLNWQGVNGTSTFTNPLAATLQTDDGVTSNLTSGMNLSYRLMPGLFVKANLGYNDIRSSQSNLTPGGFTAPPYNDLPTDRTNFFGTTEAQIWTIEPALNYERIIGKGKLSALIGTTFEQDTYNSSGFQTTGYASDALIANPENASNITLNGVTNSLYRYNAIYARLGYDWENKYLLNVTARRDGSSRFGPDKQWGNFGAIGAGWVFSKEKFVSDNLPWLSFGKLRTSYGTTGNDKIGDYQYLSTYSTTPLTYQGTTGLYPTLIGNPFYSWEVTKKLEFGLELGFLKDRIRLTSDYFRNRTGDQLVGYALPNISGFTGVEANLPALVQNTGWEFTLNTVNIKSGDLYWSTSINLSIPKNKLVSYPGLASSGYSLQYEIGQPLSISYGFTGVQINPADGRYEVKSANGSETETPSFPNDYSFFQGPLIKWYGGMGNNLSYKGFQLDFFFQFVKQTSYDYWHANKSFGGVNSNAPAAIIGNTWTTPGEAAEFARLSTSNVDRRRLTAFSTYRLADASFVRLQNAALSYSIPKSWQQLMHLQNARFYLQGENLLTVTNYFGYDPTTGSGGLPPLRKVVFGIHGSF